MKGRISMTQTFRTRVENICILILFCLSLGMFALSFLHRLPAEAALLISTEMDWMVQRASAVVLLCLCSQLRKRKHAALTITLMLIFLDFISCIPHLTDVLPFSSVSALTSAARHQKKTANAACFSCCPAFSE